MSRSFPGDRVEYWCDEADGLSLCSFMHPLQYLHRKLWLVSVACCASALWDWRTSRSPEVNPASCRSLAWWEIFSPPARRSARWRIWLHPAAARPHVWTEAQTSSFKEFDYFSLSISMNQAWQQSASFNSTKTHRVICDPTVRRDWKLVCCAQNICLLHLITINFLATWQTNR